MKVLKARRWFGDSTRFSKRLEVRISLGRNYVGGVRRVVRKISYVKINRRIQIWLGGVIVRNEVISR